MEEEKAAAYYDELSRKGEGAARFKQGLGFSSAADSIPERGSAIASSSSFLNQFVKANEKGSQIRSIRDKLKKKKKPEDGVAEKRANERPRYRESRERRRSRSRERRRTRRERSRNMSSSPRRGRRREEEEEEVRDKKKIDYSRSIKGYDHMSASEKVKAKMKLQLHETGKFVGCPSDSPDSIL